MEARPPLRGVSVLDWKVWADVRLYTGRGTPETVQRGRGAGRTVYGAEKRKGGQEELE
nr:MAG TPA: hypothetical protein [Caudoviricetes sp.]